MRRRAGVPGERDRVSAGSMTGLDVPSSHSTGDIEHQCRAEPLHAKVEFEGGSRE